MPMTDAQRLWEAWMAAYLALLADPAGAHPVCPSHGDGTVQLAFTGDPDTRIGYATVWCDTCHEGIAGDRSQVDTTIPILPFGMDPDERAQIIPVDVRLLPPDPYLEDDDEHTF